jgi:iron complex transport system substrate-binding protein
MVLRPRSISLILVALLLAACGQGAASDSTTPASPTAAGSTAAATPPASSGFPVELTDDAGRRVAISAQPERIVSLAPSNTEIVCALGACDRIVGVNDYRDGFPDDVAAGLEAVPDVASFTGVDREAVVAAEPDLVLAAGNELTSSSDIDAMSELGLTVLVLYPESLSDVYADIRLVGRAIGAPDAAGDLETGMRERVRSVRAAVEGLPAPRTFYEVGVFEGSIYTAGSDSFLASLVEIAGGDPITGDALTTAIQLEDLVAADPELILLGDAAYDASITAGSVADRPGWSGMTAVRDGNVLVVTEDLVITRPGPRIVDGLEALARAIHPQAFG